MQLRWDMTTQTFGDPEFVSPKADRFFCEHGASVQCRPTAPDPGAKLLGCASECPETASGQARPERTHRAQPVLDLLGPHGARASLHRELR